MRQFVPPWQRRMQLRLHSRMYDSSFFVAATEAADERARQAFLEKTAASAAFERAPMPPTQ